jgi:hypothetical protein
MKWPILVIAAFLLCGSAAGAIETGEKIVKQKSWWDGKFILSTFASVQKGDDIEKMVSQLHAIGLNTLECNTPLEYSSNDAGKEEIVRTLNACEKYGMKFFVTDHDRLTGVRTPSEAAIKSLVSDYSSFPALGGYYVWDEPGTGDFAAVKNIYEILRKEDPSRLPLNAMLPSYGPYKNYADYAAEFVKVVDPPVLSFDYYGVIRDDSDKNHPIKISDGLYNDLAVWSKLSTETGKPLWFYASSCHWANVASPTMPVLSAQVFTAIAYGAKGIQYFEARGHTGGKIDFVDAPVNQDGSNGPTFELFKSFDAKIMAMAPWLSKLKLLKVMHTGAVPPENIPLEAGYQGLSEASENLIISFHEGPHAKKYMIVVNKDANSAHDVFLQFSKKIRLLQVPDMTELRSKTNRIEFTLAPGGGKLFEIAR